MSAGDAEVRARGRSMGNPLALEAMRGPWALEPPAQRRTCHVRHAAHVPRPNVAVEGRGVAPGIER
eukprot:5101660-Prymnesium_polylepis.1